MSYTQDANDGLVRFCLNVLIPVLCVIALISIWSNC